MTPTLGAWIADTWRRNRLAIQLSALTLLLLFIYLIPNIYVVIKPGEAGVLWRRFSYFGLVEAGTDTRTVLTEGVAMKAPWDQITLYDIRLQNARQDYEVLTKGGLPLKIQISVRFRAVEEKLGLLHRYAGPQYRDLLVLPKIGSHARVQIGMLNPEEVYTSRRAEVERAIANQLSEDMDVRLTSHEGTSSQSMLLRIRILGAMQRSPVPLTSLAIARLLSLDDDDSVEEDLEALVRDDVLRVRVTEGKRLYRLNSLRTGTSDGTASDLLKSGTTLVQVEDVLIEQITLPEQIDRAIQNKLVVEQQAQEYDFRLARERKEKERKRIEAEGIRAFQDIVAEGISDRYLRWKGIDATLELAKSENAKVVVIGNAADGLPLILGPLETGAPTGSAKANRNSVARPAAPPSANPAATPKPVAPGAPAAGNAPAASPSSSASGTGALSDNTPVGRVGTAAERAGTPTGAAGAAPQAAEPAARAGISR